MTKELVAYLRSIGNTDENGEPSAELLAAAEIEKLDADAAGAQAELASVKACWAEALENVATRNREIEQLRQERHQLRNELTAAGLENKRLTRTLESVRASLLPYRTGHVKDLAAANIRLIDEALTGAAAEPSEGQSVRIPTSEREAELMAKLGMKWLEKYAPHRLKDSAETRDYLAARDAHDRVALELYRYKRCLYRANGRLMQIGQEPEKLDYSDSPELKSNPAPSASSSGCFYPNCDCLCSEARESLGQLAKSSEVPRDRACDCSLGLCSKASRAPDQYCRINPP